MELTLVIMAAGMGSRYGGLKQIDPIGPNGEIILEYSIYDAIKSGFKKVVFIIREEMKSSFKEFIEEKIKGKIQIEYVIQSLDKIPDGYAIPEGREKPFGTGHAILCCKENIQEAFTVINADDYYGHDSFRNMADFLLKSADENEYAMVGFKVKNTLTEFGAVARGVCNIDDEGYLTSVKEYTEIKSVENCGICYFESDKWNKIEENTIVSMNIWGFKNSIFSELEKEFKKFLETIGDNPLKKEFYIPSVVDNMILNDKAKVKVLSSEERWYGVTYREDRAFVQEAIRSMVGKNYPENLWGEENY